MIINNVTIFYLIFYRRKKGKRSVPSDFESDAVTPLMKLPKQSGEVKDKEEEIKKEIEAANLGKSWQFLFHIFI